MEKGGWSMRSKRDRTSARFALRSVLMDELNNRGVKWWGKENRDLVDRLTDEAINTSNSKMRSSTVSMRSNIMAMPNISNRAESVRQRRNSSTASKGNSGG